MVSKLNIKPPTENRFAMLAQPWWDCDNDTASPDDSGTSAPGSECGSDDEIKRSSGAKNLVKVPLVPVTLETRTLSEKNLMILEAQLSMEDDDAVAAPELSFDEDKFHEIAGSEPIPKYAGGFTQAWGSRPSKTPRKHQSFECRSEAAYSESAYSMVEGLDWEEMQSTPLNDDDFVFPALEPLDTDRSDTCTCASCSDVGISLKDFLDQASKVESDLGLKDWNATRKETMRQLLRKIEEEQGDRPRSARRFPKNRPAFARRIGPSSYSNPTPGFAKAAAKRRERFNRSRISKVDSTPVVPPSRLLSPMTPLATPPGFMKPCTPCRPIPETPTAPVVPDCLADDDAEVVVVMEPDHCGPVSNTKSRRSVVTPSSPVAPIELRWTSPVPEKVHSCPSSVKSDEQDKVFFKTEKSLSLPQFLERSSSLDELHRSDCKAQEDWCEANGVASAAENIRNSNQFGPQTVTDNESHLLHELEEGNAPDSELLRRVAGDCYLRRCSSKSRKFHESINGALMEFIWHAKTGRTPSADLLQRVKEVLPQINTDDLATDFEPMKRFMGQDADAKAPHPALVLSGVDTRAKMPHLKKDPATRAPEEREKVWSERDGWTYLNLGLFDKNVDANLPEDKSDPKWKRHHDQQQQKTKELEERYMAKKRKARWKAIARKERQHGRGNFIIPPEPKLTKKEEKEIRSIVSEYGVHRFRNRGICRVMFQKKGGDGPAFKAALAMLRALKTMNRLRALGISSVRWMCASDEADFAK